MAPNSASHGELAGRWIPIFRAGEHTSMEGKTRTYTEADLDHIVSKYNPDHHEAPAVIGHPADDAPAYGWVRGVRREGGELQVSLGEVNPDFDRMVQSGAFKKRSASFYVRPEGLELRHVAFLGAQPPAIKGLANIKFEEGETTSVEFQEASMSQEKTVREQISEFFTELLGRSENKNVAVVGFTEADAKRMLDAALAPLVAENAALKKKVEEQAASFAERERKITAGEQTTLAAAAVNKLRSSGKWVPAFAKMGLTAVFAELAKQTETVEFGEGDQKQKATPLDILVSFLEKMKKIVPEGVSVSVQDPKSGKVIEFSDPRYASLPPAAMNSVELNELAKARARDKNISFGEALSQVAEEYPHLTVPGHASAGAV